MAWERQDSHFMWVMVACLLVQGLLIPVMSTTLEDQKNYYSPDPHAGTPPSGSPPHGSTPSPHHGTPSPHHGGYNPTPSTPSTPSPPTNCENPPHEPSTPSSPPGGGGYHYSPPTSGGGSPPVIVSPPSIVPGTPTIPTPPFLPDPNSPTPGTCIYWSTHPALIWGLLGWWGSMGHSFGVTSLPGFGANMSLQQALSNTRTDGYGALYREATASWLNSLANHKFPFTTNQVRQSFVAALHSEKAAGAQAQLFKLANEGRLKQ